MSDYSQIRFFQKILKELYVSSCIIKNPKDFISAEVDLHLREELFDCKNYASFLKNSFSNVAERTVYRFFDEYDCHYVFLKISEDEKAYCFVGPYLNALPDKEMISRLSVCQGNPSALSFLSRYYASLPIVEDENLLLSMTSALGKELWGSEDISMQFIDYVIPDGRSPIETNSIEKNLTESKYDLEMIEKNYNNEKLLMQAVSSGKLHRLIALASSVYNNGAEARLTDSLRDRKNYLIILKTLLRKAAEYGGVHPLHLHKLSSKYAGDIESLRTLKQSVSLQGEMIRGFCALVKKYSLKKYSLYVSQTITLVQYDLTAELGLSYIANKLNVNASYLSELFHREYGMTLTDFIGKERIDHAVRLLENTKKTVQEIAGECGILDQSYVTKLFKKYIGMTPRQFKETLRHK